MHILANFLLHVPADIIGEQNGVAHAEGECEGVLFELNVILQQTHGTQGEIDDVRLDLPHCGWSNLFGTFFYCVP